MGCRSTCRSTWRSCKPPRRPQTGARLATLCRDLLAEQGAGKPEQREYEYYPTAWRAPQAALANHPAVLRRHCGIPDAEKVVCGMALGHADPDARTNALVTKREDLSGFVTFHE